MRFRILENASILGKTTLLVLMLLFATTFLNAQTTTFAQFSQKNSSNDFIFTNNNSTTSPNANLGTITNGVPVDFKYPNGAIANLPVQLQGFQDAHLFVTSSTTAPATQVVTTGTRDVQTFNQTITIQIIRDTPTSVGIGSGARTNLLTATISPLGASQAGLSGNDTSNSTALTASSSDQVVTYTSDFLNFSVTTARDLGLTFSSVTPDFSISPTNGILNSFAAAGAGTFASTPAPTYMTPTAGSVSVSGRVRSPNGRGVSNARVTLTYASGASSFARTNFFGYYQFNDVTAGETVVLSVSAKLYRFESQVLNLSEETNELNFTSH